MEKSETIINLSVALNGFHKEVGKIKKDSSNPFYKNKYADLSSILDAINEPLNNNGLSIIQLPKGTNELETILLHTSGEFISSCYTMTPVKNDPQGLGSVITYQRRYALGAILSLNIDVDDDGNGASDKTDKKPVETEKTLKEKFTDELNKAIALLDKCDSDANVIEFWNKYPQFHKEEILRSAVSKKRAQVNTK